MGISSFGNVLFDWDQADMQQLILGLYRLKLDAPTLKGQSRFAVSANYLLGSSKLLDSLPWPALRRFDIDPEWFSGSTPYVVVAGPSNPECVVLVENPQAFEAAIQADKGMRIAWVVTFGYGLSQSGDDYGRQLATYIESQRKLITLVRAGNPPPIASLLQHPTLYFWGDLDKEGLRIYWRLKSKLPQLRLSNQYKPMLEMLKDCSQSHPYVKAVAKDSQNQWTCADGQVQALLNACFNRAVDQEAAGECGLESLLDFVPD